MGKPMVPPSPLYSLEVRENMAMLDFLRAQLPQGVMLVRANYSCRPTDFKFDWDVVVRVKGHDHPIHIRAVSDDRVPPLREIVDKANLLAPL